MNEFDMHEWINSRLNCGHVLRYNDLFDAAVIAMLEKIKIRHGLWTRPYAVNQPTPNGIPVVGAGGGAGASGGATVKDIFHKIIIEISFGDAVIEADSYFDLKTELCGVVAVTLENKIKHTIRSGVKPFGPTEVK